MSARAEAIVDAVLALDPLAELPRTGWLQRGVRPCESIADHAFGVALVTMLLVDALRAEGAAVDGELALRMAIVHDAPEARTGDVPMPVKTPALAAALAEVEERLVEGLLPPVAREAWHRLEAGGSLEARLVRAADKIHLLAKALAYEQNRRGELGELWAGRRNFDDQGIPVAAEVFAALAARAGRSVPP